MNKSQSLTFSGLAKFFKGLPPELIGEMFQALFSMWEEKYGEDEFELDYEILDDHLNQIASLIETGLNYDQIIKILTTKDKIYGKLWKIINNSVVKHIPVEKREDLFILMVGNQKLLIPASERITMISGKKIKELKKDNSKIIWKGTLQEAAIDVRRLYQEDQSKQVREYKNLKDAASEYFDKHKFVKYDSSKLNKENFYSLVKKSG